MSLPPAGPRTAREAADGTPAAPRRGADQRRATMPNGGDFRRVPNAGEIARRRRLLRWTKWVLPVGATLILVSIAAWPEIDRSLNSARLGLRQASQIHIDSGRMIGPRYRGLDGRDRPYMITADEAQQGGAPAKGAAGGDRIILARPVADVLDPDGSWLRITGDHGVYMQHDQRLDLSGHVTLYRSDGIMMTTETADLDLRRSIVATADWVHAEGPFGVLDAQGSLLSQRGGIGQFRGPARLVLNDDRIARPGPAPAAAATPPTPSSPPAAAGDTP